MHYAYTIFNIKVNCLKYMFETLHNARPEGPEQHIYNVLDQGIAGISGGVAADDNKHANGEVSYIRVLLYRCVHLGLGSARTRPERGCLLSARKTAVSAKTQAAAVKPGARTYPAQLYKLNTIIVLT